MNLICETNNSTDIFVVQMPSLTIGDGSSQESVAHDQETQCVSAHLSSDFTVATALVQ
jgi:hypothetical protein